VPPKKVLYPIKESPAKEVKSKDTSIKNWELVGVLKLKLGNPPPLFFLATRPTPLRDNNKREIKI